MEKIYILSCREFYVFPRTIGLWLERNVGSDLLTISPFFPKKELLVLDSLIGEVVENQVRDFLSIERSLIA